MWPLPSISTVPESKPVAGAHCRLPWPPMSRSAVSRRLFWVAGAECMTQESSAGVPTSQGSSAVPEPRPGWDDVPSHGARPVSRSRAAKVSSQACHWRARYWAHVSA